MPHSVAFQDYKLEMRSTRHNFSPSSGEREPSMKHVESGVQSGEAHADVQGDSDASCVLYSWARRSLGT
jgi:hypothetical protein